MADRPVGSPPDIQGRWRIVELELWDLAAIELMGPAFIELGDNGLGSFRFVAVEGSMDCRTGERQGRPCVEFTWDGFDDCDPAAGRGWAATEDGDTLCGHIYFHLGDDSGFRAVRER